MGWIIDGSKTAERGPDLGLQDIAVIKLHSLGAFIQNDFREFEH